VADKLDELEGVDLARLDLDHIDLSEEPTSPWWRRLALVALLVTGAVVLWIPTTNYYRLHGDSSWMFLVLGSVGIGTGILLSRLLWRLAEEAAAGYAEAFRNRPREPKLPPEPPSALRRWLTLVLGVGGAIAIIVGVPASTYYASGSSYDTQWFLGAGGAVAVGVILGRWLVMQAAAQRDATASEGSRPFVMPPWAKWAALAVIVALGLTTLIGAALVRPGSNSELETTLGGIGFIVGIAGAIWLGRRFDEVEQRSAERALAKAALAQTRKPPAPGQKIARVR
jgi:hypothetical protein